MQSGKSTNNKDVNYSQIKWTFEDHPKPPNLIGTKKIREAMKVETDITEQIQKKATVFVWIHSKNR